MSFYISGIIHPRLFIYDQMKNQPESSWKMESCITRYLTGHFYISGIINLIIHMTKTSYMDIACVYILQDPSQVQIGNKFDIYIRKHAFVFLQLYCLCLNPNYIYHINSI